MLQQTTVAAVLPYYKRWLEAFPDVFALARAPLQKVLKAWEGLGYYDRARRLHRAARILCQERAGSIPRTYADLRRLPGFGPYITAAVLSLSYGQPFPVLDANVRRVLMRLKKIPGGSGLAMDAALRRHLDEMIDRDHPAVFNQAMMELGALVCRPRNPLCLQCPVHRFCAAFECGEQEVTPPPRKKRTAKIETAVGVIESNGKFLIQKRPSPGLMAGFWEFPGGKRERGESPKEALQREIREELGVSVNKASLLLKVRHAYTRFQVTLYAYETSLCKIPRLDVKTHRWVSRRDLKRYPFPSGNAKIIKFLETGEKGHRHERDL